MRSSLVQLFSMIEIEMSSLTIFFLIFNSKVMSGAGEQLLEQVNPSGGQTVESIDFHCLDLFQYISCFPLKKVCCTGVERVCLLVWLNVVSSIYTKSYGMAGSSTPKELGRAPTKLFGSLWLFWESQAVWRRWREMWRANRTCIKDILRIKLNTRSNMHFLFPIQTCT